LERIEGFVRHDAVPRSARVASGPRLHWREYVIEAAALGTFMLAAVTVTVLLEHPGSPVHAALPSALLRRALTGVAMGLTAVALIYSPPGRRSGLHMNPAVSLTFLRLGKMRLGDTCGYVAGQFAGATVVMAAVTWIAHAWVADPAVNFVQTLPGPAGAAAAFGAEAAISFGMMLVVLTVSSSARWAGWTGVCAGSLVALYITFEAPLSGMSMNPARTFGPSLVAGMTGSLWIYSTAPVLGMLAASEIHVRLRGAETVRCAKLHHDPRYPCIFHCTHTAAGAAASVPFPLPAVTAAAAPMRTDEPSEVCS
jgi:aquaporin Z